MKLWDLKPAKDSHQRKKIVGRGSASGHGGTSTRGHNGQNSRSGGGTPIGFEGGQMPLIRRIPKRGFKRKTGKEYTVVKIETLEKKFVDNDTVTKQILMEKGIINGKKSVKILGNGSISKKLNVKVEAFTESARKKITEAKGTVEVI